MKIQVKKRFVFKIILKVAVVGLLIGLGAYQQISYAEELPGHGITIKPIKSSELESRFQAVVVVIGLERLGYKVAPIAQVSVVPAGYIAVAQGDADFWPQVWEPIHDSFFEKAGGTKKLTKVGVLVNGAGQGYLIDKRTAKEFNITNVEQLKDPKIAKLFDSDGDGKANLVGCPPGWGCERVIEHHMDAYKLRSTVTHNQGDFVVIHTDSVTRYKAGERVLYYAYTPLWLNQILVPGKDVEWLEVPHTSLPPEQMKPGVKTKLPDGRNVGFPVVKIRIAANNKFLAANPAAKRWFELVTIPVGDVNSQNLLIFQGEESFEAIRGHAEKWVKDNQAQFDAWIEEAKKAAR
jgi:glycine betaine/proline transport system substrate-binding protein